MKYKPLIGDRLFGIRLGWAYDLKTVSEDLIRKRAKRTGDGTSYFSKCIGAVDTEPTDYNNNINNNYNIASAAITNECLIWGWDDQDMKADEKENAIIINNF